MKKPVVCPLRFCLSPEILDKWVKIEGWKNADAARQEILDCVERYDATADKPHF